MKEKRGLLIVLGVLLAVSVTTTLTLAQGPTGTRAGRSPRVALGTGFTYQGQLKNSGAAVNGTCDFQFGLWSDATSLGSQVGSTVTVPSVNVTNGLFTAPIDFGANAFNGDARYLGIAVACPSGSYTTFSSRQTLTPAPMALALSGLYTQQNTTSPNLIGGYSGNTVTSGVYGATIGGGGSNSYLNRVTDSFGTVSGGQQNQAGDDYGTTNDRPYATVGGGVYNSARGEASTIGGGWANNTWSTYATVNGGRQNSAALYASTIGGGTNNLGGGESSTVSGGYSNSSNGNYSTIGGGESNSAGDQYATVGGGYSNNASNASATIAGGWNNTASNNAATVSGGASNVANGPYSTVSGGGRNTASSNNAAVGGGDNNTASGYFAVVGGGQENTASGQGLSGNVGYATVGGGYQNGASGPYSTVGGGYGNHASTFYTTVAGGHNNNAYGDCLSCYFATIGGGENNTASTLHATIGGGYGNTANGWYATIPGGKENIASYYSFAAGANANAIDGGSFVWSSSETTSSWGSNTFTIRAHGGVRFYTASGTGTGVQLSSGGGSWGSLSDRNVKANFALTNGRDVLVRVASMPIETWNYKSQDTSIRHIGPMAQDFYAAFGVGEDDTHITTVDADGVALAAIQGLNQIVEEKDARITALEQQNAALEARVTALEQKAGKSPTTDPWNNSWMLGTLLIAAVVIGTRRWGGAR